MTVTNETIITNGRVAAFVGRGLIQFYLRHAVLLCEIEMLQAHARNRIIHFGAVAQAASTHDIKTYKQKFVHALLQLFCMRWIELLTGLEKVHFEQCELQMITLLFTEPGECLRGNSKLIRIIERAIHQLTSRGCTMKECADEWFYRQIVDRTQDAIIFANREGQIQLWNSGAESIFGYSAEEAMGQSLDIIIPEKLRVRHWEGYRKVMQTGSTRYGRELLAVPATRKDGTRISIEFSIVLVRSSGGDMLGSAAIIRDVTARWRKERELRDRLAALENSE